MYYRSGNHGVLLAKDINYSQLLEHVKKRFRIEDDYVTLLSFLLCRKEFQVGDDDVVEYFAHHVITRKARKLIITTTKKRCEVSSSSSKPLDFDHNNSVVSFGSDENVNFVQPKSEENCVNLDFNYAWQLTNTFKHTPKPPSTPFPVIKHVKRKSSDRKCARTFKVGDEFDDKDDCIFQLGKKALFEGFEYKPRKLCKLRYEALCAQAGCKWSIFSSKLPGFDKFVIISANDIHTCSKTQINLNHRNATVKLLSRLLAPRVSYFTRIYKARDIQKEFKIDYKENISYKQAWLGRDRIRIFLNSMRPLIIIDVSHLKGRYLGTNLVAVGMDGNNQIIPIATGVCQGERPSWIIPLDMQGMLPPLMEKHLAGRAKNKDHIPSKRECINKICSRCGKKGHSKQTCTGPVMPKIKEKVKRKRTSQLSTSQPQIGIRSPKDLVTPEDQENVKHKKTSTSKPQRIICLVKDLMTYEEFTEFLEKIIGINFQGLYYRVPGFELENGLVRVSNDKELPKPRRFCNDFSVDELVNRAKNEVEYDEEVVETQQYIKIDLTPLEKASQDEAREDNWAKNEVKYDEEAVETQQQIEIDLTPLERASLDEAGEDNWAKNEVEYDEEAQLFKKPKKTIQKQQQIEIDSTPFERPETQDRGCGYFMWKDEFTLHLSSSLGPSTPSSSYPGPSTCPSYSPRPCGSALNIKKAECSNCKFLAENIKTLEAKIKILEGTLEMERHPENHTFESAAIVHELYNDMGKLDLG
nr:hypothetical protein [Tanacetum cinerariifolium]